MKRKVQGKITSVFPDHINTDDITPGWTLQESTERKFFGKHAFANYDPDFVVRSSTHISNIVIAGANFGSGSSREQAIYSLQENKVTAVIARSFPDIFYRNALNNGLILITLNEVSHFGLGDEIEIDLHSKAITHKEKTYKFEIPELDAKIFSLGGKTQLIKNYLSDLIKNSNHTAKKGIIMNEKGECGSSQTIAEKIISKHIHREAHAGDRLDDIPIDILFINDAFGPTVITEYIDNFSDVYAKHKRERKIFDSNKVFFIIDHDSPPSTVASANSINKIREFCKEQNCHFYKPGDGIEHVVLIEDGYILPGAFVLGTDSHTCTNGALNSFAFGIGTTDATYALATGCIHDFVVPQTIRVELSGEFQKGVYAKDLILYLLGLLGVQGAVKKVLEFGGTGLKNISIDGRTTIANMAVEMGARTAIMEYDEVVENYIKDIANYDYEPIYPDKACAYDKIINIDLTKLEPCVAFPHKPDNVTFVSELASYMQKSQKSTSPDFVPVNSLKINNAFLGACTNGKYEDIKLAANLIRNKKVAENIDFVVIPASRKIYNRLLKEGILQILVEAGANVESSTCGPCFGKHKGLVGAGNQIISSSNRNFMGRMGSKDARVFLASPATVVASAITGEITDPRKFL